MWDTVWSTVLFITCTSNSSKTTMRTGYKKKKTNIKHIWSSRKLSPAIWYLFTPHSTTYFFYSLHIKNAGCDQYRRWCSAFTCAVRRPARQLADDSKDQCLQIHLPKHPHTLRGHNVSPTLLHTSRMMMITHPSGDEACCPCFSDVFFYDEATL